MRCVIMLMSIAAIWLLSAKEQGLVGMDKLRHCFVLCRYNEAE